MKREQVHDLMENELRCVQRGNYCDRDCAKCPLVKDDKELIEAYGYVIKELEQEPNTWSLDDAREDFMSDVYNTLDFLPTNNEANRIIDSFDRVTSGIKQEPVIDKIRAEIEELRLHKAQFLTSDNKICIDSQDVLNVIDKYKSEVRKYE